MSNTYKIFAGLLIAVLVGVSLSAHAQTTTNSTTSSTNTSSVFPISGASSPSSGSMPVLYNSSGSALNNSGANNMSAGWYYLSNGNQVYYYGNGTYYDPASGTYGGSISNPNGTAGYVYPMTGTSNVGSGAYTTPGVPNTGGGGNAGTNWALLAISALGAILGATYVGKQFVTARSR